MDFNAALSQMDGLIAQPRDTEERSEHLSDAISGLSGCISDMSLLERQDFYAKLLKVKSEYEHIDQAGREAVGLIHERDILSAKVEDAISGIQHLYDSPGRLARDITVISDPTFDMSKIGTPFFRTFFAIAIRDGNMAVLERLLVTHREQINERDQDGNTALHLAAKSGNLVAVQLVLAQKPNLDAVTNEGDSALILAIRDAQQWRVALALINAGANCNLQDIKGNTPLMEASRHDQSQLCPVLLRAGANPNLRSDSGDTALHIAVRKVQLEVVQTLINHHVDCAAEAADNRSALAKAIELLPDEEVMREIAKALLPHTPAELIQKDLNAWETQRVQALEAEPPRGRDARVREKRIKVLTSLMLDSKDPRIIRVMITHFSHLLQPHLQWLSQNEGWIKVLQADPALMRDMVQIRHNGKTVLMHALEQYNVDQWLFHVPLDVFSEALSYNDGSAHDRALDISRFSRQFPIILRSPAMMRAFLKLDGRDGHSVLSAAGQDINLAWLRAIPDDSCVEALKNKRGLSPLLTALNLGNMEFVIEALRRIKKIKPEVLKEIPLWRYPEGYSALSIMVCYQVPFVELRTEFPEFFTALTQQRDVAPDDPLFDTHTPVERAIVLGYWSIANEIIGVHPKAKALLPTLDLENGHLTDADALRLANALLEEREAAAPLLDLLQFPMLFSTPNLMHEVLKQNPAKLYTLFANPRKFREALQQAPEIMKRVLQVYLTLQPRGDLDRLKRSIQNLDAEGQKAFLAILKTPDPIDGTTLAGLAIQANAPDFLKALPPRMLYDLLESPAGRGKEGLLFDIAFSESARPILFSTLSDIKLHHPQDWDVKRLRRLFTSNGSTLMHMALTKGDLNLIRDLSTTLDPALFDELLLAKDAEGQTVCQRALSKPDTLALGMIFGGTLGDYFIEQAEDLSNQHPEERSVMLASVLGGKVKDSTEWATVLQLLRVPLLFEDEGMLSIMLNAAEETLFRLLSNAASVTAAFAQAPQLVRRVLAENLYYPNVLALAKQDPNLLEEMLPLVDSKGNTLLYYAAVANDSALLELVPADRLITALGKTDKDGYNLLQQAAAMRQSDWVVKAINKLSQNPATVGRLKELLSATAKGTPNLVWIAIREGLPDVLRVLHGVDAILFREQLQGRKMGEHLIQVAQKKHLGWFGVFSKIHELEPRLFHQLMFVANRQRHTVLTQVMQFKPNPHWPLVELIVEQPQIVALLLAKWQNRFDATQPAEAERLVADLVTLASPPHAVPISKILELPIFLNIPTMGPLLFNQLRPLIDQFLDSPEELRKACHESPMIVKALLGSFNIHEGLANEDDIPIWKRRLAVIAEADPTIIDLILQAGSQHVGDTVLHGHLDQTKFNLIHALPVEVLKAILQLHDEDGHTILQTAAREGKLGELLTELRLRPIDVKTLVDALKLKDAEGYHTALEILFAAQDSDIKTTLETLTQYYDFDPGLFEGGTHETSALRACIYHERWEVLPRLLEILGFKTSDATRLAKVLEENRREKEVDRGGGVTEPVAFLDWPAICRFLISAISSKDFPLYLLEIPRLLGSGDDLASGEAGEADVLNGIHPAQIASFLADERAFRAALKDHPRETMRLISHQNWRGETPLHDAAAFGNAIPFKVLAKEKPSLFAELVQLPDGQGDTVVHIAAANGRVEMLRTLRELSPALLERLLVTRGSRQETALAQALRLEKSEVAKEILVHEIGALTHERNQLALALVGSGSDHRPHPVVTRDNVPAPNTGQLALETVESLQVKQAELQHEIQSFQVALFDMQLVAKQEPDLSRRIKPYLIPVSTAQASRLVIDLSHLAEGIASEIPSAPADINITKLQELYHWIQTELPEEAENLPPEIIDDDITRSRHTQVDAQGNPTEFSEEGEPIRGVTENFFDFLQKLQAGGEMRDAYEKVYSPTFREKVINLFRHFTLYFEQRRQSIEQEIDPITRMAMKRQLLKDMDLILIKRLATAPYHCLDRMATEPTDLYYEYIERDTAAELSATAKVQLKLRGVRQNLFKLAVGSIPTVKDPASNERYYHQHYAKRWGLGSNEMFEGEEAYDNYAVKGEEHRIERAFYGEYTPLLVREQIQEALNQQAPQALNKKVAREIPDAQLTEWISDEAFYEVQIDDWVGIHPRSGEWTAGFVALFAVETGMLQPMNAMGDTAYELKALKALHAPALSHLWEVGEYDQFYDQLKKIVDDYFTARFGPIPPNPEVSQLRDQLNQMKTRDDAATAVGCKRALDLANRIIHDAV